MLDKILERFTEVDARKLSTQRRNIIMGKAIDSPDVNKKLYTGLLPADLVRNKTILDLGSCYFLSGAWSLYHGAKHVTGVDTNETTNAIGSAIMHELIATHGVTFTDNWNVITESIDNFISNNNSHYDIILIAGTLHNLIDKTSFLLWCIEHCNYIVIESNYPPVYHYLLDKERFWSMKDDKMYKDIYSDQDKQRIADLLESDVYGDWFLNFIKDKLPLFQYVEYGSMQGDVDSTTYTTPNQLKTFFTLKDWKYNDRHCQSLTKNLPDYFTFPYRYCLGFSKENS
jgi:hypothetical protein